MVDTNFKLREEAKEYVESQPKLPVSKKTEDVLKKTTKGSDFGNIVGGSDDDRQSVKPRPQAPPIDPDKIKQPSEPLPGSELVDSKTGEPLDLPGVTSRPGTNLVAKPPERTAQVNQGSPSYVTPERASEIRERQRIESLRETGTDVARMIESSLRTKEREETAFQEFAGEIGRGNLIGSYDTIKQRISEEMTIGAALAIPTAPAAIYSLLSNPKETVLEMGREAVRDPISFAAQTAGASVVLEKITPIPRSKPVIYEVTNLRGVETYITKTTVMEGNILKTTVETTQKPLTSKYRTNIKPDIKPYKLVSEGKQLRRADFTEGGKTVQINQEAFLSVPEQSESFTTIKRTPRKPRKVLNELYKDKPKEVDLNSKSLPKSQPEASTGGLKVDTTGRTRVNLKEKSIPIEAVKVGNKPRVLPNIRIRTGTRSKTRTNIVQDVKLQTKQDVTPITTPITVQRLGSKLKTDQKLDLKINHGLKPMTDVPLRGASIRPRPRILPPLRPPKIPQPSNKLVTKSPKRVRITSKPKLKPPSLSGRFQSKRVGLTDVVLARTTGRKTAKSAGFFRVGRKK